MMEVARETLDEFELLATVPAKRMPEEISAHLARFGLSLPAAHIAFLAKANGASSCGGYFRLFGVGEAEPSLEQWNMPETWKFAWATKALPYLCFGSTAWGDQYAYHAPDGQPDDAAPVYLLDAVTMIPEKLADDFQSFFAEEYLRNASAPYDSLVRSTRATLGDLADGTLLAFQPPLQLGGNETTSRSVPMPARSVMIANGDLSIGLENLPDDAMVEGVMPFVDEMGRARLRMRIQSQH